jgi:hypothetical protein
MEPSVGPAACRVDEGAPVLGVGVTACSWRGACRTGRFVAGGTSRWRPSLVPEKVRCRAVGRIVSTEESMVLLETAPPVVPRRLRGCGFPGRAR